MQTLFYQSHPDMAPCDPITYELNLSLSLPPPHARTHAHTRTHTCMISSEEWIQSKQILPCLLFLHDTISIWEVVLCLLQLFLWMQVPFWLPGQLLTPTPGNFPRKGSHIMCQLLLQVSEPWQHRVYYCIPWLSGCHFTTIEAQILGDVYPTTQAHRHSPPSPDGH